MSAPVPKVGSVACVGIMVEGTGACVLVDEAGSFQWGVQHWSLLVLAWSWVLALSWRSLGELLPFDITWGQEVLVVQCPELGCPTSEAQA